MTTDINKLIQQANVDLYYGHFEKVTHLLAPYQNQLHHYDYLLLYGIALAGNNQIKEAAYFLCQAQKELKNPTKHCCSQMEMTLGGYNLYSNVFAVFQEALTTTPNDPFLQIAYIDALYHTGQNLKAIHLIKNLLNTFEDKDYLINKIANIFFEAGKYKAAFKIYKQFEEKYPDDFHILGNLAAYYNAIGNAEMSLQYSRKAIMQHPNHAAMRVNYSICLLKYQYYYQGWSEHDWRLATPNHTSLPKDTLIPTITDQMDITGKRILITQEEGYGDTLMYLRLVPELIKRGAIVTLWIADIMEGLCKRIEGNPIVKFGGEEAPPFDWHCPFISLPRALNYAPNEVTAPIPYLTADPQKVQEWRLKIPQTNKLKVGLVWGGAPHPGDVGAMISDRKRSIPLYKLFPLLKNVHNACFVSLQMGAYSEQIHGLPEGITLFNPMNEVKNMDDTAGIIMNLDIILSVDTSVVHLAGGLGKPVLLMDRYDNCWRWISGAEYSPWYPNVRIIRQTYPRIWKDVIQKATSILQEMASNHSV